VKSDTKKIIPNRRIDLKGEVCPYTFVKSKLAMEELRLGEVLEVIGDHEPAVEQRPLGDVLLLERRRMDEGHVRLAQRQHLADVAEVRHEVVVCQHHALGRTRGA